MAEWKKVIVSGSNAELNQVTASFFSGDGSALTNVPAGSVNIESFTDGTSITVATSDKLLVSDAGTEKYINVSQLPFSNNSGTVDTSGTPVDNDFAKFTDANTIEGRSASEVRSDLGLATSATTDTTNASNISSGTLPNARLDAQLQDVAGLAVTNGGFIVGDGSNFVLETGATARTSLGLGSIATQASSNVSISGGSISGITDLAVADGGTGASNASGARTNLGLGSLATASEVTVDEIAAGTLIIASEDFEDTDDTKIATVKAILGQNYLSSVNNSSWSGTDLAVTNGGTGASNASGARTNLGLAIGSDVQAYDAGLDAIAGLAVTNGNFIVGNGTTFVAESGATARTSLGLGSLATLSSVNNSNFSGTDLSIANGGTGQSTAAAAANALLNTSQGGALTIGDGSDTITIAGNLTVSGTTTTVDTTNLNVTDQWINLNDGGAAADGGFVVEGAGVSFGWDNGNSRWGYLSTGATEGQTDPTNDAFAAQVVLNDDLATYRKAGNIRVDGGEIYIYV